MPADPASTGTTPHCGADGARISLCLTASKRPGSDSYPISHGCSLAEPDRVVRHGSPMTTTTVSPARPFHEGHGSQCFPGPPRTRYHARKPRLKTAPTSLLSERLRPPRAGCLEQVHDVSTSRAALRRSCPIGRSAVIMSEWRFLGTNSLRAIASPSSSTATMNPASAPYVGADAGSTC